MPALCSRYIVVADAKQPVSIRPSMHRFVTPLRSEYSPPRAPMRSGIV